ncbi:DUF2244 domain-containing protein [Phreatobacter stygius]|nr:DUF2244 domain-containing protein [Phreatobacter stygius]
MSGSAAGQGLPDDEPPLFAAILTPHRSLGRTGFIAVMIAVAGLNLAAAAVFSVVGAWPVLPFLGIDVALVYLAFRANYRHARAFEEVVVTPTEIRVRKVAYHGRSREWRFNTAWTRLTEVVDDGDGRVMSLTLDSGRHKLDIATFLPPIEREGFGKALRQALAEAKRGPTRTTFT